MGLPARSCQLRPGTRHYWPNFNIEDDEKKKYIGASEGTEHKGASGKFESTAAIAAGHGPTINVTKVTAKHVVRPPIHTFIGTANFNI